ncbi:MAG: hypothetical protein E3J47_06480 [Candidatus Stahlbacteria bacterium]|nr:MAG: hypothetical protein E3J47_06480 [Candidatus Stahlbacteria bacterium]
MKKLVILLGLIAISSSQPFNNEDPRAIIEKVRIYRLTQELDLTTEQAMEFFPKLNELQKIEKAFRQKKIQILFELRNLLKNDADDKEILKVVSKYEDIQRKKIEDQIEKIKEMWKILTPVQRAKFLIFQEEFDDEIRKMIRQVKKHRQIKP